MMHTQSWYTRQPSPRRRESRWRFGTHSQPDAFVWGIRSIGGQSFAFLPHRFLREGFFASLRPDELRLYVLLVLAADRNGLSFHHYDSICSLLEIPLESYIRARNALITKDLIAFDGTRFQVLSLPERPHFETACPQTTDDQFEQDDPATIRRLVRTSLTRRDDDK